MPAYTDPDSLDWRRSDTFRLPPTAVAPHLGRLSVRRFDQEVEPVTDTVELLVSELITNTVKHGGLHDHDTIELTIKATEERLRVEVKQPPTPIPRELRPRPSPDGHWGLYLVDRLSDRWGVEHDDGMAVWFEIDLAA